MTENRASYNLDEQIDVITGSANGIGRALAIGLAEAGADIVVADLASQTERAEETAQEVRARGRRALVLSLDVTQVASIEAAVAAVVGAYGHIDFWVNNAGINIRKPVLDYTEAEWDRLAAVNLKGVLFCTQAAARQMRAQGHGKIVNMASQLATVVMHDRSVYAILKAAVAHMAKAFAVELGSYGITANAVGPTFVSTPMTTSMFTDPAFVAENLQDPLRALWHHRRRRWRGSVSIVSCRRSGEWAPAAGRWRLH